MNEELEKLMLEKGITIKYGFDGKPQYYKKNKMLTGKEAGDAGLLHSKTKDSLKHSQTRSGIDDILSHPLTNYFAPPTALYTAGSKVAQKGFEPGSVALDLLGSIPSLKGVGTIGTAFLKTAKIASALDDVSELKNKKGKKKLAYGGSAMNVESPMQALFDIIRNSEESALQASNDPTVAGLRMLGKTATSTGMSMAGQGLAQSENLNGIGKFFNKNMDNISSGVNLSQSFIGAYGGTVPSEIEGEEVVELPDGSTHQAKGPSHENGGIDLVLPEGAEVFSKRIKIDGVSIADRKKKREKKEFTLEELLTANSTDGIIKNSLDRTKKNNIKEEKLDTDVQKVVGNILSPPKEEFRYGGPVDGENPILALLTQLSNGMQDNQYGGFGNQAISKGGDIEEVVLTSNMKPVTQKMNDVIINPGTISGNVNNTNPTVEGDESGFDWNALLGGLDTGDLGNTIGMAGNVYSAFAPMKNTLKNRAGDTPNVNAFANFGEDGLAKLEESGMFINQMKDEALGDLELSRQGTVNRNNNSARGINTLRALNLASDAQYNKGKSDIYNSTAGQMMQLMGQQANAEDVQDQMVMKGEETRDLADRMDRDNFFSQMATDISTKGKGIQQIGKDLNQTKQNEVAMNLINQLSQYGITVDKKGNLTYNKAKLKELDEAKKTKK